MKELMNPVELSRHLFPFNRKKDVVPYLVGFLVYPIYLFGYLLFEAFNLEK